MGQARQNGQADVEGKVLEVLEHGGAMSTQQIKRLVRAELPLLPGDLEPANERPNEQVIDQTIANALNAKRGLSKKGFIELVAKGTLKITERGRAHLSESRVLVAEMLAGLPDDL